MVSAQAGWGVDMATGDILHTDGTASSWRIVDPPGRPPANNAVKPVFFLGGKHAWAVVGGSSSGDSTDLAVARTTNAGGTWEVGPTLAPMTGMDLDLPSGDSMSGGELGLDFVNDQDGWLGVGFNELSLGSSAPYPAGTGQGLVLYHTTDGGVAWSVQLRFTPFTRRAQGLPAACALADVVFTSPLRGWETGECVALTQNGGLTWRKVTMAKPLAVAPSQWRRRECGSSPPSFASATVGWLALDCTIRGTNGKPQELELAYQTSDGGARWTNRAMPLAWPDLPPSYANPDGPSLGVRAWLLGVTAEQVKHSIPGSISNRLFETTDAGKRWTLLDPGLKAGSVDFVSTRTGFATQACWGAALGCSDPKLWVTHDAGRSWTLLHPRLVSGKLSAYIPYA
jgi:photosystem II stability/assembly factor-like uncharacterized protein